MTDVLAESKVKPEGEKSRRTKSNVSDVIGQRIMSWSVVGLATVFMLAMMQVDRILSRTTPTGGDNAVHIWTGDYVRRVLIPQARLTGWSMDSFGGLPVLSSYFPLPTWVIVGLSYAIPYQIAYKIVSVLGIALLPFAVFRLGRKAKLPWPEPMLLACGAFPFLMARHFKILGGNIMSTMAGEFSFSISLTLTVFYMGSLVALIRTGRGRTRTTLLLTAVVLCHIVPAILAIGFTASCLACELRKSLWRRQILDLVRVGLTAVALTAFWVFPFASNLKYANSMDYERNTRWFATLIPLLPHSSTLHTPADGVTLASIAFICALIGVIVGVIRRDRFIATMTLTALFSAVAFGVSPRSAMWNNRLVPAWFFCVYVLGAAGSFYTLRLAAALYRKAANRKSTWQSITRPAKVAKPTILACFIAFGVLIAATISPKARTPFSWANGNYSGFEPRKQFAEYRNLINVLETLPCGRMFSEPSKRYENYGSSLSMTALPYWTKSCIQTIEGLYYESSQTTPFHYLTANVLAPKGVRSQRRLPYGPYDFAVGVARLRKLGVRYMMLNSKEAIALGDKSADLKFVVASGPYRVYEINDNSIVSALSIEPVVINPKQLHSPTDFVNAAIAQWVRPADFPPVIAERGPKNWVRADLQMTTPTTVAPSTTTVASVTVPASPLVTSIATPTTASKPTASTKAPTTTTPPPKRGDGLHMPTIATPVVPAAVSDLKIGNLGLSFHVDRTGTPILVRVSSYPNWRVKGASGPYRVGPNFMVVVPNANDVKMKYRYTPIEKGSFFISGLGVIALVFGARSSRRRGRDDKAGRAADYAGVEPAIPQQTPQVNEIWLQPATLATVDQDPSPTEICDRQSGYEPDVSR